MTLNIYTILFSLNFNFTCFCPIHLRSISLNFNTICFCPINLNTRSLKFNFSCLCPLNIIFINLNTIYFLTMNICGDSNLTMNFLSLTNNFLNLYPLLHILTMNFLS
ncbi:hypothetical protein V8G54_020660, partial [Vigna mungo]